MNDTDKQQFQEVMLGAGEVYNREITKPLLKIYFTTLINFSIEQVSQGFFEHMKGTGESSTFFPKPADIIKKIQGTEKEQKQDVEDRAMIAWACIEGEIRRIGHYGTLKLDDKQALAAVKHIGGWNALCMATYEEMVWKRKDFMRAYDCYERVDIERLPNSLPGIHDLRQHKEEGPKTLASILGEIEERAKPKLLDS